ncbi:MAG: small multi-drug export protein [Candidatus Magasanikbacteria bacterium CG11_big_fil_rev_8_21_14_0_20_39_34]|uniref:Small multi-drug export protein n=1 Tax=Candidatus Magasanikbacteria bacterium CG11_big_fil_rev_8_21_14_0_20_39_34 TaxID=1974653 RepID=A0A2H0N414_9BACT|nr:MAG: small multi-drug export protein [Candidatus Magasanikbacteria bacterium CG11_big_fil_rev_8_21_14_0_20_39_34]
MFHINPVDWFSGLSPEWAVFWTSMIPITEIRASIPLGIEVYGLPIWKVWVISVLGDILPPIFILMCIPYFHKWAVNKKFFGPVLAKLLERAEKKFSGKFAKYGVVALVLFVGIPLPLTGSWTGSLAAFVFNIPYKKAVKLIFFGVCLAATIVTLITLFASEALHFFL